MQIKSNYNLSYKLCSSMLIILHLATFGPIRDALAFSASSATYKLNSGAINSGGNNRNAASAKLWQDVLGEPCIGQIKSANYILSSGLLPLMQSNPPILTQNIPYQTWAINASKDNAFDLDDYFSSPDGYPLTYTAIGNSKITVNIDPATHIVSFSQPQDWFGVEKVYFYATDTEGGSLKSNEVTLQIANSANLPNKPVIVNTQLTPISIKEGDLITLTIKAYDLDNQDLTFTYSDFFTQTRHWKEGNYWYSEATWQTGAHSTGHYMPKVTVSDTTSLTDTSSILVNIGNFNHPPVLDPITDIIVNEGELALIVPHASDPDNDPIVFYYSAPFDTQGKWLTGYDNAGNYDIRVTASDGIDTVSRTAKVIVNNTNRPPEATLTLDTYTVKPSEQFNIILSASDPDSDTMSFTLKKDSQEIASGNITGSYNTNASFSDIGDHSITATVTDSGGKSITVTKGVDVTDPGVNKYAINPVMGDFNGDSLSDLGLHNSDTGTWEICLSDGGVFRNAVDWLTGFGNSRDWWPIGGDFNGDGKTDIGVYNNTTGELKVALSSGSGFSVSGTWLNFPNASTSWQAFTGNFNGDKYTDFALYNKDTGEVRVALGSGSGFGAFTTWITGFGNDYVALAGDFNADSLSDLCLFKKSTGEFKVAFSNSKAFVDGATWISGFATDKDALVSDFNNDGLADIGYWDKASGIWYYAISTGDKFVNKGNWLNNFGANDDDSATTGDFNGDGITDSATFNRSKIGIQRWDTRISTNKPADLLTEIDNGIGGKTKVTYTYAAKSDNSSLPFPVYVASAISSINTFPAERSATYTQSFIFSGGYYDATEREFRGFAKIVVTDPITNNYAETYFYQGKPGQDGALKGQIDKVIAYDGNGREISQTLNTYEVKKSGPQDRFLGFPALIEQTSTVWEENGSYLTTKDEFTYDNIGNPIEQTSEGNITKTGDEKYTATTFTPAYESGFNRLQEVVLKNNKDGDIASKKDFAYDEKGNLIKETAWLNTKDEQPSSQYTYDSLGNLTSTTNALGGIVTTDYETDFYAYPEKVTNSLGQSIQYVYEPKFGLVKSVTDANGNISSTIYDSLSRPLQVKNAYNQIVTTYGYPDFNTKITTNALNLFKTEYIDGLGRKYKTVSSGEDGASARNIISEIFYNNRGLTEKESLPHYVNDDPGQIAYTRYEYDIRGRAKKTISDFPGSSSDAEASVTYVNPLYAESSDPLGHRKGALKDVYGNILEVTEFTSDGAFKTKYAYDIQNNLIKTTDNLGNISQIFYDSLGRKIKMIDPDMGTWLYEYDLVGNLRKQTDAKGQVMEFEYDALNRLTSKQELSPQGTVPVTYIYDDSSKQNCLGRLSKITDLSGSTEFFYDKLGREVESIKTIDGISYAVERTYDVLDRLITLKYPDADTVTYAYDANSGLLESVKGLSPQGTVPYVQNIAYNAKGQIKNTTYGNGVSTVYTYGQDLRLSRIYTQGLSPQGTVPVQDLNYTFDRNGNVSILTDNLRNNIRTYAYDDLDRLTRAENVPAPGGGYSNFDYRYDSIGNMTYKSDVGMMTYGEGLSPQGTVPKPHALTSAGGYSYRYDANGNMTVGKNKTLTYDAENRLIEVNELGTISTFTYDGDGGRVKKGLSPQVTVPEQWTIYVGSLFEKDSSGKITKHVFAGANRVCSIESAGNTYYYHSDHLGSSNVITDQNGAQAQYCEYTPYGTLAKNEVAQGLSPQGTVPVKHLFTGKELDNTGLYLYGARYYDPEIGRFITADSIVQAPYNPQTLNRYSYCGNNPINYVDPTGHSWFSKWWGKIVGAIVGAVATIFTGNMMVGFQAFNFFSSLQSTISTGSWGAFAGGLAGGLIGGYVGGALAGQVADALGKSAFTFGGGFLIGATEMGVAGFGGSFGSSLGGGASFGEAMKQGAIGLGIGAAVGGLVEGSYLSGMQNIAHGMDREAVGKAANVERQLSLEIVEKPIPVVSQLVKQDPGMHWGLRIADNYNEFNGTWDFDYVHNPMNTIKAIEFGMKVPGIAKATNQSWITSIPQGNDVKYVTNVYGNIQANLGKHYYKLDSYTCHEWVNNRINLRNDNFSQ